MRMAELLQLDKAAAQVGKSEVTLRRLIKAGKIPYQKEKTLTGFIYLVDPEKVRSYYQIRGGGMFSDEGNLESENVFASMQADAPQPEYMPNMGEPIRVAVANESGDQSSYWQKKADLYEDKYNTEVVRHSQTREELGVWRGRAEQSNSMLLKLLPSPQVAQVSAGSAPATPVLKDKKVAEVTPISTWSTVLGVMIAAVLAGVVGFAVLYIRTMH
jgi:hypothetical protein